MRTRHILTALALPALFAACTADEFESANFEQGLQERAKLSKDFVLKTGNSVDTRYAVEGDAGISFTYEQGKDSIGAAIIDQYDPKEADKPENWEIIPSLAGNFPFVYQGSDEWKSDYELGVGHYMFVYPYNKSDNNRAAVKYELPVIQKMYETEDGPQVLNAAIEKGNKAVAVTLLREGETLADVSMKNLFTYPKVTINFDNGEKVTTVSQVVLKAEGAQKFIVKGGFDHRRVAALFGWNSEYTGFSVKNDFWNSATKSVDWDKVDTYDFLLKEGGADEAYGKPETSDYIIVKFPNNTKVKLDANTQNKYVEARFMMPSLENFTADNKITMYVYTDNGIYKAPFNDKSFSFKSTTSNDAKKYALQRSRGNALTLKALNSSDKAPRVDNIVTTVEDWNALVDTYGNTTVGQPIAIVGTDFAFNENVKMPSKCVFTIKSDVAVDGEATISNVTVDGTVTVEKGATLTTSGSFYAETVENNGTLNIAPAYNEKKEVVNYGRTDGYRNVLGVEAVINNGVLNVEEETVATFKLLNKKGAKIENKGEITISDKETDEGNFGVINNSGTINTTGFTNCAREYNPAGTVVINEPTINNEGRIISQGTFTNYATIMNNGEITCDAATSGTIVNENAGLIDSAKDMITYITTNNGRIVVYKSNPGSDIKVPNQDGTVEYTASEASIDFTNSIVTDVIASKTFAITKIGNIKNVTMTAGGTLTIPAAIENLTVNGGTVELDSNISTGMLTVAQKARITVPAGKVLYAEAMDNKGSILVSGTFRTNVASNEAGLVQADGKNANIEFGYDPNQAAEEEAQEKAYKAALVKALTYYMNNSYNYKKTYSVVLDDFKGSYDVYLTSQVAEFVALDGFGREITSEDLTTAANTIATSNKTALTTSLKATTFKADATLYKDQTTAYKSFKEGVVAQKGTLAANFGTLTNAVAYAATVLSDSEIAAILEVTNPTMYVWEGCDLDKLVELWASYDGIFTGSIATQINGNEYSDAKVTHGATQNGKVTRLINWVKAMLNANSLSSAIVSEVQKELSNLGIKASNINSFSTYTNAQMYAVDNALAIQ